jgi:hypothetical protein
MRGGGGGSKGPVHLTVIVNGARTDRDIREMSAQGTREVLAEYDRQVLPSSVQRISRDPKRIG